MNARAGAALLLIDVQQGFDESYWGRRNNPEAERRMAELLEAWRSAGWPVIHVQHMSTTPGSPLQPGLPGNAIRPEVAPIGDERLFQKSVNSAFIGTGLEAYLREQGIDALVIVGLTTDHCISTTSRMAGNLGFAVTVIDDATATFDRTGPDGVHYSAEQMHRTALASLHGEFGEVLPSSKVLAWLEEAAS
ncbi:MAG TPA: cysteine hydrolase family protein [Steroidobacteraceae bacterium]|nr:cysteine hydrolase family protein [Steroidobacteraceae bacterium]